jgi:hypothetical protein
MRVDEVELASTQMPSESPNSRQVGRCAGSAIYEDHVEVRTSSDEGLDLGFNENAVRWILITRVHVRNNEDPRRERGKARSVHVRFAKSAAAPKKQATQDLPHGRLSYDHGIVRVAMASE